MVRADLISPPEYPYVWYLDGTSAQILSHIIRQGYRELLLRPTKQLVLKHGITDAELGEEGTILKRYPVEKTIWLNSDPQWGRLLCLTDFKGNDLSYILDPEGLRNQLIALKKQLEIANARIAYLEEQLRKILSKPEEFVKQNFGVVEQFIKSLGLKGKQVAEIFKEEEK